MSAFHLSDASRLARPFWPARLTSLIVVCGALVTWVVAGCSGGEPPAMMPGDGGVDAAVFDASVMYPGEGTACRFTTECGELQLCVDDACARHERFAVDDLLLGEPRVATGFSAPPFSLLPPDIWTRTLGTADPWMLSYVQPGRDGPQLVIVPRQAGPNGPLGCVVAVIGAATRAVEVPGVGCQTATVDLDGRLFFYGIRQADDAQVFVRERLPIGSGEFDVIPVPASVADTVRSWGYADDSLAMGTSMIADATGVVVSVRLGAYNDLYDAVTVSFDEADQIAFLFLDEAGAVTLLPTMTAVPGDRGWLVRDDRALAAVMYRQNGDVRPFPFQDILIGLSTPREQELTPARAQVSRIFQLTATNWMYSVNGSPPDLCQAVFLSSDGERRTFPWLDTGCGSDPPFGNLTGLTHGAPNPGAPVWIGHPQMQALVLTGGSSPAIRGFASPDVSPVLISVPLDFGWVSAEYGGVSRFGKSVEGYYHFEAAGPQVTGWFEFPLTNVGGGL